MPYQVSTDITRYQFLQPIINNIQGKRILDIGCGNGEMSVFLAKRGAEVSAIDNTHNGIQNVQALADFNGVKITTRVIGTRVLIFFRNHLVGKKLPEAATLTLPDVPK